MIQIGFPGGAVAIQRDIPVRAQAYQLRVDESGIPNQIRVKSQQFVQLLQGEATMNFVLAEPLARLGSQIGSDHANESFVVRILKPTKKLLPLRLVENNLTTNQFIQSGLAAGRGGTSRSRTLPFPERVP